MKTTSLFLVLALMFFQCAKANVEGEEQLIEVSEGILEQLVNNEFEAIRTTFNNQLLDALSADHIENVWTKTTQQIGDYQSQGNVTTDKLQGYRVVYVIIKFEQSPAKLKVVFDDSDKVAGLFLVPTNAK